MSFPAADRELFFTLIQNSPFGILLIDADFRLVQISRGASKPFRGIEPLFGRDFAEILRIIWPEPFASDVIARFRHTLATGDPYHSPDTTEQRLNIQAVESYDWQIDRVALPDGRQGVVGYFYETTHRVNAERDAYFLNDLAEQVRTSVDPCTLAAAMVERTAIYLHLSRCFLAETDEARDRWWVLSDYHGDLPPMAGDYRVSDYPIDLVNELRAGRNVVCADGATDARWPEFYAAAFAPLGLRAYVCVPLRRDGRWLTTLVAATQHPRSWSRREVALLEAVAERMWNALETVRVDASLRASEHHLREAHEQLEERVRQRTTQLNVANMELEHQLREQRAAQERISGLLKQLVTIQEEERRRVAREIHDQLGQQMTALRMYLEALQMHSHDAASLQQIQSSARLAEELDRSIDFLTWQLRPSVIDEVGVSDALASLVGNWSQQFHVAADYDSAGVDDLRLPSDVETHLYRIAQEALHNVYKHAHASRVLVQLEQRDERLVMRIADDGRGLETAGKDVFAAGMGLSNMRDRAVLAGAELLVFWSRTGTTIEVRLPISAAA